MTSEKLQTPQEFFLENNGKGIDFDKAYGNQCVDIIQQYNKDVIGGSFLSGATALKIWEGETPEQYEKVLNTTEPENKPKTGDILFFSFNHTSVCVTADELNAIISFDQNYPEQGHYDSNSNWIGTGVAHFQTHTYGEPISLLGWWTPKNPVA